MYVHNRLQMILHAVTICLLQPKLCVVAGEPSLICVWIQDRSQVTHTVQIPAADSSSTWTSSVVNPSDSARRMQTSVTPNRVSITSRPWMNANKPVLKVHDCASLIATRALPGWQCFDLYYPVLFTVVQCSTMEPISNGALNNGTLNNGTSQGLNDTITYSCVEGYELVGSATRTCQLNGTWSGSEPYCQGNSHSLQAAEIIHVLVKSFTLCYHSLDHYSSCKLHPHRAVQNTWTCWKGSGLTCTDTLLCWQHCYLYLWPRPCGRWTKSLSAQ